ncbi:MAG: DNA-processing protein DprA [Candidatus Babeliales bacterium]
MNKVLVHLGLIDHIGPATIAGLITQMGSSLEQLYGLSIGDCVERFGMPTLTAQRLVHGLRDTQLLEQELARITKAQCNVVTIDEPQYPALLRTIYAPPPVLYYFGTLPSYERCIALVGARKADSYAQAVIETLVPDLVAAGWQVISGGALGVDTLAHAVTIAIGGSTTAVLGSGLLELYPFSNKKLFERIILHGGCVMTPFPLLTTPLPGNFPARNRIIAGLSHMCVVIQAQQKSGARITAQFALEQGREVGAVPGAITNPLSEGCHALIREGAQIITSAADIFALFGQLPRNHEQQVVIPADGSMRKTNVVPIESSGFTVRETSIDVANMPLPEAIKHLCAQGPCLLDDLITKTGAPLFAVQDALFDLNLAGVTKQLSPGLWGI